ncbi:MAG: DUF807 family protein [Pseudomonadota bacterium]
MSELLAILAITGAGKIAHYLGTEGSIALPAITHTPGSGIYTISFATEKKVKDTLPPFVLTTITDTTSRALISKLSTPVSIVPYSVAVKFIYTLSFSISVSQVQCLLLGLCTTTPADPDTLITVRIVADAYDS